MGGYKKSNAPQGHKVYRPKNDRKERHAFHAKLIEAEHKPVEWPPTRDLSVGGYRRGERVNNNVR